MSQDFSSRKSLRFTIAVALASVLGTLVVTRNVPTAEAQLPRVVSTATFQRFVTSCVNDVETVHTCMSNDTSNGAACPVSFRVPCFPNACDAAMCRASCSADSQCAQGAECLHGTCAPYVNHHGEGVGGCHATADCNQAMHPNGMRCSQGRCTPNNK
jgi:hypothetical protein